MSDPRIHLDPNLPRRGGKTIMIWLDEIGRPHLRANGFNQAELVGVLEIMKTRVSLLERPVRQ